MDFVCKLRDVLNCDLHLLHDLCILTLGECYWHHIMCTIIMFHKFYVGLVLCLLSIAQVMHILKSHEDKKLTFPENDL